MTLFWVLLNKMGRPVQTYEQLKEAKKKQDKALMHAKENIKFWKDRARTAEKKVSAYVFIKKKPDYFFSFSGHLIFRRWYRLNGISPVMAELLVTISYIDVFFKSHINLFKWQRQREIEAAFKNLLELGYIIKVKIPGKSRNKQRTGWVLTQKGKDFERDYEKYYDKKMAELTEGKLTPFNFRDGAYYRRIYVSRKERRAEQGGGMLPRSTGYLSNAWRDQNINNEKA